jgi:hypothetical protein
MKVDERYEFIDDRLPRGRDFLGGANEKAASAVVGVEDLCLSLFDAQLLTPGVDVVDGGFVVNIE